MKKVPISLLIDDGAPGISVYYTHAKSLFTADGRPLEKSVPNDFLDDFCDVTERYGIQGKLSVVPMPGGLGDVAHGIAGYPEEDTRRWLDAVRARVCPNFSLSPEMLTHAGYWDLKQEKLGDLPENVWSQTQDRGSLTAYIVRALEILKEAGLDISGVSSPWNFGVEVQKEYELAISDAMAQVFGKTDVWYALHAHPKAPGYRPKMVLDEKGRHLVWFRCSIGDVLWQTINSPEDSPEYISRVADELLTADGTGGAIAQVLREGSQVIFLTHWQSLYSNGTRSGLRALELAAQRIEEHLSDQVEWTKVEALMQQIISRS